MSNNPARHGGSFILTVLALTSLFLASSSTPAKATTQSFTFFGVSVFTILLESPITFTLTQGSTTGMRLVIKNTGNFAPSELYVSTTFFSIESNMGYNSSIDLISTGQSYSPNITVDDLLLNFQNTATVVAGEIITVNPGYLETFDSLSFPPPASGSYTVFLADGDGQAISVVPEPSAYALLAMSSAGLAMHLLRRKLRPAA